MEWIIRQASPDDGGSISEIYAPYILNTPITFEEQVPGEAEMSRRIEETLTKYPFLVAQAGSEVVGYAYGGMHSGRASYRWSVNVAIYLKSSHHRRGIGRGLYDVLLSLLTSQGFVTAYAGITLPNPASVGIHEAIGFTPVGIYRNVGFKMKAWRDVGWWERQLVAPPADPAEPLPWPKMPRFEPRVFCGDELSR